MGRYAKREPRPLSKIAIVDQSSLDYIIGNIEVPAANWGAIGGSLSSQSDLNSALNGKAPSSHEHSYEPANANIQTHVGSPHIQFTGLTKITVSGTQPSNPSTGDIWIQTT